MALTMLVEKCLNCRYSRQISGGLSCRRYPPSLIVLPQHPEVKYSGYVETEQRWPWVDPEGWCGEWKSTTETVT